MKKPHPPPISSLDVHTLWVILYITQSRDTGFLHTEIILFTKLRFQQIGQILSLIITATEVARQSRSTMIFETFFALKVLSGLHMNSQKLFRELFRFCKDIRSQSSVSV